MIFIKKPAYFTAMPVSLSIIHRLSGFQSVYLSREVAIDIFLPPEFTLHTSQPYRLLILNDGQDAWRMRLAETWTHLHQAHAMAPTLCVAISAGADRIQEYGVAAIPDFKGRGAKASAYTHFILNELLPYLEAHYPVGREAQYRSIAGCSLGGLSAFDIALHHPNVFGSVGCFSGSFWWRSRDLGDGYTDADRIAHRVVSAGNHASPLRFWFQCGTADETADRNKNGIIDSIDDTVDLMTALRHAGFSEKQMTYVEVEGGTHDPETWGKIMPEFLHWAFGREA